MRELQEIAETIRRMERRVAQLETREAGAGGSVVLGKGARVRRTSNQTIPSSGSTLTPIDFEEAVYDQDGFWDAGDPTRLTVSVDGIYFLLFNVAWEQQAGGFRFVEIIKNNTTIIQRHIVQDTGGSDVEYTAVPSMIDAVAGDYFEARVQQTSGISIDVLYVSPHDYSPIFSIHRVGDP